MLKRTIKRHIKNFQKPFARVRRFLGKPESTEKEILWANIFRDTISNSSWLKDKAFSLGRSAAGYPAMYVIYRILNEVQPTRILELGLGQSTRMITQYALAHSNVQHTVVEHDASWVQFFEQQFKIPQNTKIQFLDLENIAYKNKKNICAYKDFQKQFSNQKFDFIFIDGPFGSPCTNQYSRIDVLQLMPTCLSDSFIIILDDCHRENEQNTLFEMENILKVANISYKKGLYTGEKTSAVLCSSNLKFVCSM